MVGNFKCQNKREKRKEEWALINKDFFRPKKNEMKGERRKKTCRERKKVCGE
jgi:hypothetical protein